MNARILSSINPISREWLTATKTVGVGLFIALGLHALAEVRSIPSESMTPTLQVGDRLILEKISYHFHAPQRGDIIVFKAPPDLTIQNIHDDFVKRIIGLPGEVVAVKHGRVYVNGSAIVEPYIQASPTYNYGPVTVPGNQYFVLGDNRNHSYDSHFWGFVPSQNIIGHGVLRLSPLPRFGAI
ncbi:signal peptidase I [Leptodesmis sichuanensis A121]|nr:signal peptidase I [Leptodesmis sichuanensis A121]